MHVYHDIDKLPDFSNAVITIGTFDGVHSGHVHIIQQLISEAEKVGGTPVVITFFPHPKQVVNGEDKQVYVLNTPFEKYELLNAKGIEHIVVVPFDRKFSEQSPSYYIEEFLVKKFRPHTIIIGYDHRFGKNREGDYHLLESASTEFGFKVKEIPEHVLQNVVISSTKIREALKTGNIEMANKFLGYNYLFTGIVTEGNKLGRTIGFPTANINVTEKDKLIPSTGVYAVTGIIKDTGETFKGMMNIGVRPTIDGSNRVIEVNLFDFEKDIYQQTLIVTVRKRLRDEIKFSGLDALKEQLFNDRENAIRALG